ncbi:MAG: efflux RND transporter periplasmic adaptor subunit [Rubrivivax sp.]|nr:efflux RND transporter periplasmic adaptor subunit [Rubrivivax sp.]
MNLEELILHRRCIPLSPEALARWRGEPVIHRKTRMPYAALTVALCAPGLVNSQGATSMPSRPASLPAGSPPPASLPSASRPAAAASPMAVPAVNQLDCLIQPSQTVQVGTASAGVVQSVKAERGDYVRRGQVLVQMEAQVERAALAMAQEKATQAGEMVATRGASDLAQRELDRAADLLKENFVSRTFFDRQRAELEVANGRGQQAEERRRLAAREVQLATAQLAQRTVSSPIDGVVVERHVGPGEYVEQKPVMRIAQIDPLRVDVLVPAAVFGQVAVGSTVPVTPELLQRQPHKAVITGVDRVIDAASHTFRVRLELPNPGGRLPPGLRCKADMAAALGMAPSGKDLHEQLGASTPDAVVVARTASLKPARHVERVPAALPPVTATPRGPSDTAAASLQRPQRGEGALALQPLGVPLAAPDRGPAAAVAATATPQPAPMRAVQPPVQRQAPNEFLRFERQQMALIEAPVPALPTRLATHTHYDPPLSEAELELAAYRPRLRLAWPAAAPARQLASRARPAKHQGTQLAQLNPAAR